MVLTPSHSKCPRLLLGVILLAFPISSPARESPESPAVLDGPIRKYHDALLKRPESKPLFARFFDAWLESDTIDSLGDFLKTRTGKNQATAADWRILAAWHLRQGDDPAAGEAFRTIVDLEKSNAAAWFELAKIEGRALNFDTALESLEKGAAVPGIEPVLAAEIARYQGRLLIRAGRQEEGLAAWEKLLEENPGDHALHEDVVELLVTEGLFDEAIESLDRLIAKSSEAYHAVLRKVRKGSLYRQAGRPDDAVETWRDVLESTGHGTWIESEILSLIDGLYRRTDDLTKLRNVIESMVADEPKRIALQVVRAELLAYYREDEDALEAWKKILELTPGDRDLRLRFVRVLSALDRPGEAAEQMAGLALLHPADAELKVELAALQFDAGLENDAGKSLLGYLELSDGSEYAHLRAARLLHQYRLDAEAESVFEKLIAALPESVAGREAFASFLFETGRGDRALKIWKKMAERGDLGRLLRIARVLTQKRESEAAFDLLHGRFEEFQNQSEFLAEISGAALPLKRFEEASEWARKRIGLAKTPGELIGAIDLAAKLVIGAGKAEAFLENETSRAIPARCFRADLEDRLGHTARALDSLADLPEDPFALTTLARIHRRHHDWRKAAEITRRLIELPGGRKSANLQELVGLYERAEDLNAALFWTGEWKKMTPGSPLPWLKEASILDRQGKVAESTGLLQTAARRFEGDREVKIKLARSYARGGYGRESEKILWELYEDAEDDWARRSWINELTRLAKATGRIEPLIAELEKRRRGNSRSVGPLLALAEVYRITERHDDLREVLLAAGRIEPENLELLHRLATIEEGEGRYEAAQATLEKARLHDRTNRSLQRLSRLHLNLGNLSTALALMRELRDNRMNSPAELAGMFQSVAALGEWETALEFIGPELADHPDEIALHYLHAVALEETGRSNEAVEAFLKLLGREIPNPVNPPARRGYGNSIFLSMGQIYWPRDFQNFFPAEAEILGAWTDAIPYAYQYRGQTSPDSPVHSLLAQMARGNSQVIMTPQSKAQLRGFALAHLFRLERRTEESDPSAGKLLRLRMIDAGVPALWCDVVRAVYDLGEARRRDPNPGIDGGDPAVSALLDAWPDDAVLVSFLSRRWYSMFHVSDKDSLRILRTIRKTVSDEATASVALHWLNYGGNPGSGSAFKFQISSPESQGEVLELTLDCLDGFECPPDNLAGSLANLLNLRLDDYQAGSSAISEEQWNRTHGFLRRWSIIGDEKNPWGPTAAFVAVANLFAREGKIDDWIELIRREVIRYRKAAPSDPSLIPPPASRPGRSGFSWSGRRGYRQAVELDRVTFPPHRIPGFSPAALSVLRTPDPEPQTRLNIRGGGDTKQDWPVEPVPGNLAQRVGDFQGDRVLEILAAHAGNHASRLERLMKDIALNVVANPDSADPAELLLLASWVASKDENPDRASELYERFRKQFTTDPESAKSIDLALVWLAIHSDRDSPRRQRGFEAALRLRAMKNLDPSSEWPAVAKALTDWGHPGKATRPAGIGAGAAAVPWAALPGATRQAGGVSFGNYTASPTQIANPKLVHTQIEKLIEQKNLEAAIRSAARRLPLLTTRILTLQGETEKQNLRELRSLVVRAKIAEAIVDSARPTKGARRLERVRFAALCDTLGHHQDAIGEYRKLLGEDPEDSVLRMRLLHLLSESAPDAALAELVLLSEMENSAGFLTSALDNLASLRNSTLEGRLDVAGMLVRFLREQSVPRPGAMESPWGVGNLKTRLEAQQNAGTEFNLPRLFEKPGTLGRFTKDLNPEQVGKFQALIKKRQGIYRELCELLIRNPAMAAAGFSGLTRLQEVDPIPEEKLLEACRLALRRTPDDLDQFFWSAEPKGGRIVLAGHTGTAQRGTLLLDPAAGRSFYRVRSRPVPWLVEHARETNQPGLIDDMARLLREDEKTGKTANRQKTEALNALAGLYFCEAAAFDSAIGRMAKVVGEGRVWGIIRRVTELRPEIADSFNPEPLLLRQLAENPTESQRSQVFARLTKLSESEDGPAESRRFLNEVIEATLGPAAKRRERLALVKLSSGDLKPGSDERRVLWTFGLLGNLGSRPGLAFTAADAASALLAIDRNADSRAGNFPSAWILFDNGHGLENVKNVRSLIRNSPQLLRDAGAFDVYPASKYPGFNNLERHTMIGSLLVQLMKKVRLTKRELTLQLLENGGALTFGGQLLQALTEDEPARGMLSVFEDFLPVIRNLPEDRRREMAMLAADVIDPAKFTRPITAGQKNTLLWLGREFGGSAAGRLEALIEAEEIRAVGTSPEGFHDLAEERIKPVLRYDWEQAVEGFVKAARLGEKAVEIRAGVTFSSRLVGEVIGTAPPAQGLAFLTEVFGRDDIPLVIGSYAWRPGRSGRTWIGRANSTEEKFEVFREIAESIQSELGDNRPAALAAVAIHPMLNDGDLDLARRIGQWADSPEAVQALPTVAPEAATAALLVQSGRRSFPEKAAAHFLSSLENESMPLGIRLEIGSFLCGTDTAPPPESILIASAKALAEGWESDSPVPQQFARAILDAVRRFQSKPGAADPKLKPVWREVDRSLATAMEARFVREDNTAGRFIPVAADRQVQMAILRLALKTGRKDSVDRLLEKYFGNLDSDASAVLAEMVRHGDFDSAESLLRSRIAGFTDWPNDNKFDPALAENIRPFLGRLKGEPWLAWTAEAILARLLDDRDNRAPAWPDWRERKNDLARRFFDIEFPDRDRKEHALWLVSNGASEIVREPIAEAMEEITSQSLGLLSEDLLKIRLSLFRLALMYELIDGRADRYVANLENCENIPVKKLREKIRDEIVGAIVGAIASHSHVETGAPGRITALRAVFKHHDLKSGSIELQRLIAGAMIAHVRTGGEASFAAYVRGLPSKPRIAIQNEFATKSGSILTWARNSLYEAENKEKHRILAAIYRTPIPLPKAESTLLALHLEDGLMRARKLGDSKIDSREVIPCVGALLDHHRDDREEQVRILNHALGLIRQEQDAKRWYMSFWNGWNQSSELLTKYCEAGGGWERIALAVDLLHRDATPELMFDWSAAYGIRDRFRRLGAPGNKDVLPKLFAALERAGLDAAPEGLFLFPVFFECCEELGPIKTATAMIWAESLGESHSLAREFVRAARFFLGDPEGWIEPVRGILADESRSLSWRIALARHVHNHRSADCPPDLTRQSIELLIEGLAADSAFTGTHASVIIRAFNRLPKDAFWRRTATALDRAWIHRSRFNGESHLTGRAFDPNPGAALTMLETQLLRGDRAALGAFVGQHEKWLNDQPRTIALYLLHGQSDRALAMLESGREKIDLSKYPTDSREFDLRYTPELRRAADAFLPKIADADLRFFTEILVAAAPDPETAEAGEPSSARSERLKALGGRLIEIEIDDWQIAGDGALKIAGLLAGDPGKTAAIDFLDLWIARDDLPESIREKAASVKSEILGRKDGDGG